MNNKRISFSKYNAEHLYDILRWSWVHDLEEMEEKDRKILKKQGRFGGCFECEQMGKRLEKFVGKKWVNQVNYRIKKYKNVRRKKEGL